MEETNMAAINFDSNTVEPAGSFEPLPIGDYTVIISATEIKDTKTGKGQYLQFVYDVVDGEYQGRKLFDRLNIKNENVTAQEIAQRSLSAICRSVGVIHPTDTDQLKGIPFIVKVGIRAASGEYQASNVIKEYKRCDGTKLSEVTDAAPAQAKVDAPKAKRPWEKKA
jgi:hypothetical protein